MKVKDRIFEEAFTKMLDEKKATEAVIQEVLEATKTQHKAVECIWNNLSFKSGCELERIDLVAIGLGLDITISKLEGLLKSQ